MHRVPLLIATSNRGKQREVQAALTGLPVRLLALDQYPNVTPAVENGRTFQQNAERKALHYARWTGCWTLADDSGLEVDALDGAPGIYSARYAGAQADDVANNAKLIQELTRVPEEPRTARFRCALALADASRILATATGTFEGVIVDQPRGSNGFGYDPHFFVPTYGRTAAEMSPEQKNRISHRGQALAAIRPRIAELLFRRNPLCADPSDP